MFSKTSTRLNKYISESGLCSRRDADRFIEQGNVFVNGKRAQVGDQVSPGDQVKVNGQEIEARDDIFSAGHVHGRSREERYPRGYKPIERGARLSGISTTTWNLRWRCGRKDRDQ